MMYDNEEIRGKVMQAFSIFTACIMIVGMFSMIGIVGNTDAHVLEGEGNALQLYSYFYNNDTVTIDGHIAGDAEFWAHAYARNMTFISNEDPADTIPVSMFFMNSNSYLYIGIAWDAGNNGANNGVRVFFDEGDMTGALTDGNHLDGLTNPSGERNEDAIYVNKNDGSVLDQNWNSGAGAWQTDNDATNKVIDVFNFGNGPYFNAEIRIPLSTGADDLDDSNLDITGIDEIGIYAIVEVVGGGGAFDPGHYYWDATTVTPANKNSAGDYEPLVADSTTNQWGDLKMGLTRDDTKLYSTVNINGVPAVDGNINDDLAWTNSYKRDMKFTNFQGATRDVRFYSIQDQTTNNIWCGLRVDDDDFNIDDEFYIYQERETATNPGNTRDFLLDTNFENLLYANVGGVSDDWEYDGGTWNADDADTQGTASAQYFQTPTPHYEFEFELPYLAGTEDLNMDDNGLFGFFMKFVDTDMPAGEEEFFWEMTANDELIRLNEANDVHVSVGWVDLQMGGPAVSPVQPDDGGVVSGIDFLFRIYAEDEQPGGINDIVFAAFKTENMDTFKNLFWESGTGFWSTYWDTTGEPNGPTTVTIVAQDDEGITVYVYITVVISNAGAAGNPPSNVAITAPVAPGPLSGSVNVDATAVDASYVEYYVDGTLFAVDDTSPYQGTLDSTLYPDGGHIISIRAVNVAGETQDAETYTFENWDLYMLDITDPVSGAIVTGPLDITGDFETDISGDFAELFIDDVFFAQTETESNLGGGNFGYVFGVDTALLAEGSHQIKMIAYDPDGNQALDMVTVIVDNLVPQTPTLASLIDGQFIDGIFTFQVQSDPTDLDGIDLTITNTDLASVVIPGATMGFNSASGYFELTIDTTALVDGNYSIEADARDSAGNVVTSALVNFQIDNNAPMFTVSYPTDNEMVAQDVDFAYMAEDPFLSDVMYRIDGNSYVNINATWDTTMYSDGEHTVYFIAMDESGHKSEIMLTLIVDNNGPSVNVVNPFIGQFVSGEFAFRITATDEVGVDFVQISLENMDTSTFVVEDFVIPLNSATGYYEYAVDTNSLEDGNYTVTCISYDIFGQDSGDVMVDFKIDNHAPTLVVQSPLSGDLLSGSVPIIAEISDLFLKKAQYSVDGGGWVDLLTPWNTEAVRDGSHMLEIRVQDEAGFETIRSLKVETDNNGPDIYIVYLPQNASRVGRSFKISLEVTDIHKLKEVSYTLGESDPQRIFQNKENGFFETNVITDSKGLDIPEGERDLVITAMDIASQSSEITRTVFVDLSGPDILIISPTPGETVKGTVEFLVNVDDLAGVEHVYISINKGPWIEMQQNQAENYVYHWNSQNVQNGKYDIDVRAVDSLENEFVKTQAFTVDNFPMFAFVVFLVGLIFFIIMMVLSLPKGKKPKSKKSKEEFSDLVKEEIVEEDAPSGEDVVDLDEIKDFHEEELKAMEEIDELVQGDNVEEP
jgi:hypothetical protein